MEASVVGGGGSKKHKGGNDGVRRWPPIHLSHSFGKCCIVNFVILHFTRISDFGRNPKIQNASKMKNPKIESATFQKMRNRVKPKTPKETIPKNWKMEGTRKSKCKQNAKS